MSELNTENTVNENLDDVSFLAALDDIIMSEEPAVEESDLVSVIDDIETKEEMATVYEEQGETEIVETAKVIEVTGEVEAKIEEKVEAKIEEKPTKTKTKVAVSKSDKILTRLGSDALDYITLTPDWATKSDQDATNDFAAIIDNDMAKYVGDKAINLFSFLKTGGGLNIVTSRAFDVIFKDGMLVGGKDGNIVQNLMLKPYSFKTASSQGNQMLQLFTLLEIGKRTARGTVVLNDDSTIVERVKDILGK